MVNAAGAAGVFGINLNTTGVLQIVATGIPTVSGTTVLLANTWYRISFAYVITNATTFTINLYLNGKLEASAVNTGTLTTTGTDQFRCIEGVTAAGANFITYFDEIFIDDGTDLADPGNIGMTGKRRASTNAANFDTTLGTGSVSEVPASIVNGVQQAALSAVQQNYTLETASAGDVDIANATLIARSAWVSAKRSSPTLGHLITAANNTGSAAGTTLPIGPVAVVVGQLMVAALADRAGGGTPTIADDSDANAWTLLSGPTTSTVRLTKWYKICTTTSAACTVTMTFASNSAKRAGSIAMISTPTASPLDSNVADNTDATTPFDSPLSGTLAQASEVVIGFRANATTGNMAATSPDLIAATTATTGGSSTGVGISYRLVAATTSIAPQMTGTSAAGASGTASFKLGAGVGDPKIMDNGTETSVVLTASAATYTVITDSATYPSNAAGIGMRSSGDDADTFLYDCGTIIAYYIPPVPPLKPILQAVNRASTY
jgi:hypothetical protein